MHRVSRRVMVLGGLATLACIGPLGTPEPYQTELTAPWAQMSLPVQGGDVVFSNELLLNVHHPEDRVAALQAAYGTAIEASGYKKALDTSAEDMISVTFEGHGARLALGILEGEGKTTVSITRYEK